MIVEMHHRIAGLGRVAFRSAVIETGPNVAQIARFGDRFTAKRTETLPKRRPAIDQHESHVAPPRAKQKTVSAEFERPGGGAQR